MENFDFLEDNINLDITDFGDTIKKADLGLDDKYDKYLISPLTLGEDENTYFGWCRDYLIDAIQYIPLYINASGVHSYERVPSDFSPDLEAHKTTPHLLLKKDDLKIHILPLTSINTNFRTFTVGFVCYIEIDGELVLCEVTDSKNSVDFEYKGEKLTILASWQNGVLVAEVG